MKTIRHHVFETNSSSTHCITMCDSSEFQKFKTGECFMLGWEDGLIPIETIYKEIVADESNDFKDLTFDEFKEATKKYASMSYDESDNDDKTNAICDWLEGNDYYTYRTYGGDEFETFENSYETKDGTTVIAFGFYGYAG